VQMESFWGQLPFRTVAVIFSIRQAEEWVKSTFPGTGTSMFPESVPQPILYVTSYVTLQLKSLCIVTVVDKEFVFVGPAVVEVDCVVVDSL